MPNIKALKKKDKNGVKTHVRGPPPLESRGHNLPPVAPFMCPKAFFQKQTLFNKILV